MPVLFGNAYKLCLRKLVLYNKQHKLSGHRRCSSSLEIAGGYQPKLVEKNWQEKTYNKPEKCKRGTYRMILPPPNVTGNLHLGHALMATIQDVICRQQRLLGYEVEWIPGIDHAGIATQVIVEKKVLKELGLNRHQLGREAFLKEVWNWKQSKGDGIIADLHKLGCTLDWHKSYFTMDEKRAYAVKTAFIELFNEGLIQRRNSVVNWSCALESAISDIEVDTLELKGGTDVSVPGYQRKIRFGQIYDICYRVRDSDEEIIVSTTRPETLLGDVAVAVHPLDERYIKYRNKPEVNLWHPFRKETIPLIFDVHVEKEFGSGAVKITPAHDKNDFEIGERHMLEPIAVFDDQGNICENYEVFGKLPRFDARDLVLNKLAEMQLLRGIKDHAVNLPICSRSRDIVEYMLRPQWFLHCQPLADAARSEVNSGRLQIFPSNFEIDWHRWLENCHDWCISRQLWWGHQIPAYQCTDSTGSKCWVAAYDEEDAAARAKNQLKSDIVSCERDADVLDTWFSSALLPFSAFGWPAPEYKQHYPLDLMETGHDILFFWVARMVMLGIKLTGEAPFKKILFNGIVCDAHGRKMSKSLGNVVLPQQVVQGATLENLQAEIKQSFKNGLLSVEELEKSLKGTQKMFPKGIPECGTDALRLTLCSHNVKSHFINFDVAECYTNKLFLNKIWQACRFTLIAAERLKMPLNEIEDMNNVEFGTWDLWILSRLAATLKTSVTSFDNYNYHAAIAAFKLFLYNNLCDVYLETTKSNINAGNASSYIQCATLATCLSWSLQAMSPFTPFICATLLMHLPNNVRINLSNFYNSNLEQSITDILEVCQSIRQQKSRNNISRKHDPQVLLYAQTQQTFDLLHPHLDAIKALTLCKAVHLELHNNTCDQATALHLTASSLCNFSIKTNDSYQLSAENMQKTKTLNKKKLQKLELELERCRTRMDSDGFRQSTSEPVQRKHIKKIQQLEIEIRNIKEMSS